jgi:tetratricopeptide (TPR) repeat protein
MRDIVGPAKGSATSALADSILGSALHFRGDFGGSRLALESAFQYWSHPNRAREVHLGYNFYIFNGIGLALTLWLQGYPAQATECARTIVGEAQRKGHPASLGLCLSWAPQLFLWVGDLPRAEEHTDWLISHAEAHSLGPYVTIAQGYKGILAIGRGDARLGVEILHRHLDRVHGTFKTRFKLSLVEGLIAIGQFDEGLALIDETIRLVEVNGDFLHMAEALRVKGGVLLSLSERRIHDAETCFVQALDWSRRQGARSWELRTAADLSALWAAQGQRKRARTLLKAALEQIVEGPDTSDLQAGERLLATLR